VACTFLIAGAAAAAQLPIGSSRPAPPVIPAALQLFERDWVLMNWALKHFDTNGDILLEPQEAAAAAQAFRALADTNHDGRITPDEYRAARAAILSGY
jgi:hypothetical protein